MPKKSNNIYLAHRYPVWPGLVKTDCVPLRISWGGSKAGDWNDQMTLSCTCLVDSSFTESVHPLKHLHVAPLCGLRFLTTWQLGFKGERPKVETAQVEVISPLHPHLRSHSASLLQHSMHRVSRKSPLRLKGRENSSSSCWGSAKLLGENVGPEILLVAFLGKKNRWSRLVSAKERVRLKVTPSGPYL